MKKRILILLILFGVIADASAQNPIWPLSPGGSGSVDDTAYNSTTWDGVTTVAPSKNAVRDQIEAIVSSGVSDGDKGDVTVSSSGTVWTIDNNVVTLAKMADMATASFLGRNTASTGDPEVLSIATAKTMLNLTGTNSGDVTFAGSLDYLTLSGQQITIGSIDLTTDVTGDLPFANLAQGSALSVLGVSGNSTADVASIAAGSDGHVLRRSGTTLGFGTVATAGITDDAITFAKIQNLTSDRLLGRDTASSGDTEEITVGGGLEFTGSGGIQRSALTGNVTASAGSNSTTIANNVVTGAMIALGSDAQGDIMYYNGTDWVRLGAGTSGHFLQTQGAAANPQWADASGGALDIDALSQATEASLDTDDKFVISVDGTEMYITTDDLQDYFESLSWTFSTMTVTTLNATTITGAIGGGTVDASGFNGNLATTDNTIQEIAQKLDDLSTSGSPEVQDEAYGAGNFNGDTAHGVSQDDLYDQLHIGDADDDGKIDVLDLAAAGFPAINSSGALVASRTIAEGLGIDVTNGDGASGNPTIAFDPTELSGSRTWGDASTDTIVWTFDRATGTDPTITFNSGSVGFQAISLGTALSVANGGTGIASGTSGGVPYFSGSTTIASSAALAANALVIGGGAGAAPATTTTGSGVLTALAAAANGSGGFVTDTGTVTFQNKDLTNANNTLPCEFIIACSDLTTDLTTGTTKAYFRAPYAFTVTSVSASVLTAPTGSTLIVDINDSGTTIMSTNKLSIDASELTSITAATAAGVTDTAIAADAVIAIDIDQIGSTVAGAGLIVTIQGTR